MIIKKELGFFSFLVVMLIITIATLSLYFFEKQTNIVAAKSLETFRSVFCSITRERTTIILNNISEDLTKEGLASAKRIIKEHFPPLPPWT